MMILLPFTHLRSETYVACVKACDHFAQFHLVPITNHEFGYADHWVDAWQRGETFINVEQDVVPSPAALREMWECPAPYCKLDYIYPWSGSPRGVSPIGCAKFSKEFIAEHHGLFTGRLHWHEPQYLILNASLNLAHIHEPPALHLHVTEDWPLDARRLYATPQ